MNSGKHKMNKRVQEYLDQKAKDRDEQRRKKKEALLLELGLFEKEYYDPEHPDENHDYRLNVKCRGKDWRQAESWL